MSKKKIISISVAVVAIVAVLVVGIVGVNAYIRHKNVVETGNLLGVEWYNETDVEFTITTVEELYEFAELSDFYDFKGQTVKLGADLVVNEGNAEDWTKKAPSKSWNPITGFAGHFDGQGHTISGLYGKGFERRMALFTDAQMSCSIKNLSLVNSYFETTGHRGVASFLSGGGGKLSKLYSDAVFHHKGENVGGIASSIDVQTTFEECWYDGDISLSGRDCGGIVDEAIGSRVTIKHCLFSGNIYSSYDVGGTRTAGIIGRADKSATVILSDSLASGIVHCDKNVYTGSVIGASYASVQWTISDTYTTEDTYSTIIGNAGNKGTFTGSPLAMRTSDLTGVKAYQWTTLNFDSYWATVEDGTPILKHFAETIPSLEGVKKAYDTSWYMQGGFDFTIKTREQLYGFYIVSASTDFQDCKVKLGADIVVNEGNASKWAKEEPELPWFPIAKFAGQFDGQGYTISGLYCKTGGSYIGLFGQATAPSVIQNLSIKNSYYEHTGTSAAFMGSVTGDTYGIIRNVYSNAIIVSEGNQVGGITGRLNDNAKTTSNTTKNGEDYSLVSNCWFDGSVSMLAGEKEGEGACEAGGIVGRVVQGDAIIEHCLNTGTISSTTTERGLMVGGLIGSVYSSGVLELTDSFNAGEIKTDYDVCVGSVIGRVNHVERIVNVKDTYTTKESYKVAISKGGFKGIVNGDVIRLDESWLTGYKGYQFTTLDFKNYWAVQVGPDGTPILSHFANKKPSVSGVAKLVDMSWYGADKKEMVIDSLAELYGFAMLSSTTNFQDQTVKLAADIVVNPVDAATLAAWVNGTVIPENGWITIGSSAKTFAGTFDGQGHTISGIYSVTKEQYNGLFGITTPVSMIKNFSVKDSYFAFNGENKTEEGKDASAYMGSICGDLRGDMENVYSNAILTSTASQVGGLVGRANGAKVDGQLTTCTVSNCWFDGQVTLTGEIARYAGGIAAVAVQGTVEFKHCLNTGSISNERPDAGEFLGGIVGTEWVANTVINISDCFNAGKITVKNVNCIGPIIGRLNKKGSVLNISDTYATAESCTKADGTPVAMWSPASETTINGGIIQLEGSWFTGENAYRFTTLDFPNYWAIVANDTPVLQLFASSDPSTDGIAKMVDVSWYSADAKEMIIDSVADLYGFAMLSATDNFEGQTVKLAADLSLDPSIQWLSIGSTAKPFAGTFDGQGHTIKNMNITSDVPYIGMFAVTHPLSMVKNFSLVDSNFSYNGPALNENGKEVTAYLGSVCGDLRGDMANVYSNATVTSTAGRVGGLVAVANGAKYKDEPTTCTITNCWFDGTVSLTGETARYAGGIAGVAMQNGIEIINCLNTGSVSNERTDAAQFLGGILGSEQNACQVTIKDCLNAGKVTAANYNGVGSVVGLLYHKNSDYVFENVYAVSESCVYPDGTVKTYSKYKNNTITGTPAAMAESYLVGLEGYKWTALDFANYWVVRNGKVPALKMFADGELSVDGVVRADTSWYDKDATKLYIKDEADFYGFTLLAKGGTTFADQTVYLESDLKLNKIESGTLDAWKAGTETAENKWLPIGNTTSTFQGTFDGQNHTISGVYLKTQETYSGLFGVTHPISMVKNFKLVDSYFEYNGPSINDEGKEVTATLGSVCGDLRGDMENVYSNATVVSVANRVGGLVAIANGAKVNGEPTTCTITNCWFDGTVSLTGETARYAGGIAAVAMQNGIEIINCLNTGSISNERVDAAQFVSGILGMDQNACQITIKDSLNAGPIVVANYNGVGSVVGMMYHAGTDYVFDNTYTVSESCIDTDGKVKTYHKHKNHSITGTPIDMKESFFLGVEGYKWTNLDFANYWSARKADVPALRMFVDQELSIAGVFKPDTSWYDKNATELHIKNEAEFYGFTFLVKEGKTFANQTVYLDVDLQLNKVENGTLDAWKAGTEIPDNTWIPIGNQANMFQGTFDGQMHTIGGVYLNTDEVAAGLFGCIKETSTVKNLRLVDSYFCYNSEKASTEEVKVWFASVCGDLRGDIENVYSNAYVTGNGSRIGGLVGIPNGLKVDGKFTTSSVKNCWYDGEVRATGAYARYVGGIAAVAMQGNVEIINCLNTADVSNERTSAAQFVGGIIGSEINATNLTIKNCVNTGEITAASYNGVGSIAGMAFQKESTYTFENVYAVKGNCVYPDNTETTHRVYTNNNPTVIGTPIVLEEDALKDTNAYKNTLLDFYVNANDTGEWVARTSKYPTLEIFAEDSEIASLAGVEQDGWYSDDIDVYYIGTVSAFKAFRDCVNGGKNFSGKTVYLTDDLDLNPGWTAPKSGTEAVKGSPEAWTSIGNNNTGDATTRFYGIFDGQGHEIKGVYSVGSTSYLGLFGYADSAAAVVKNFRLTNSYVEHTGTNVFVGGVVGYLNKGTLSEIYCNAVVKSSGTEFGGIAGRAEGLVEKCWFDGEVYANRTDATYIKAAGIVGTSWSQTGTGKPINPLTIKNCLNTGTIKYTVSTTSGSGAGLGGIYGGDRGYTILTVEDCINKGIVTTNQGNGTGSIVGNISKNTTINKVKTYSTATISNCYGAKNSISNHLTDKYAGRILGYKNANCTVTQTDNVIKETETMYGDVVYKAVSEGGLALDYNVWIARTEDVPVLRCFVGTVVAENATAEDKTGRVYADTSWLSDNTGTSEDPYQLDSAGDLLGLSNEVNAGNTFEGKYIQLTKGIDYNEGWTAAIDETTGELSGNIPKNQWIPIGDGTNYFLGTFDGQGNTISGIYVNQNTTHAGLFGYLGSNGVGEVKNLQIVNSYIKGEKDRVGGLAGVVAGKATNVYVNAFVIGDTFDIGGVTGRMQGSGTKTIDTCWFDGFVGRFSTATTTSYIGGVVGIAAGGTNKIINCLNTGTVYNAYQTTNANQSSATGGILGGHKSSEDTTVEKCLNLGDITTPNQVYTGNDAKKNHRGMGPIIGYINASTAYMNNCVWLNVAELDGCTDGDDRAYGLAYKGNASTGGTTQYTDEAALIAAVKANETAAMVLGFDDAGEFTVLNDESVILKDFENFWLSR